VDESNCKYKVGVSGSEKYCVTRDSANINTAAGDDPYTKQVVESFPLGTKNADWRKRQVVNPVRD